MHSLERGLLAVSALALVLIASIRLPAGEGPGAGSKEPTKLAKDLVGTWLLAGTPDNVTTPPKNHRNW